MNENIHSDKHKTYYHVSPNAGIYELRPSVPRDVEGECDTPRVCVCPSVALAFDASDIDCLCLPDADIHIYAVDKVPDVTPLMAHNLGTIDALDMREHWYTHCVKCTYIGTMAQWYASRGIT